MDTNPRRYLVRMFVFLLAVGIIATLLAAPLIAAFMGNPALNGVILGAFGIGSLYVIRQTLRLMPERNWLLAVKPLENWIRPNGALCCLLQYMRCSQIRVMMPSYPHFRCDLCSMAWQLGLMKGVKSPAT